MFGNRINKLEKEINKLQKCCCESSGSVANGCCYFEVTRLEAEDLVFGSELVKGGTYKIIDRGDAGIILRAAEDNIFEEEGVRIMRIPNPNLFLPHQNSWRSIDTYAIDSYIYWMGYIYKNLTGLTGAEPNNDTINWERIEKDTDLLITSEPIYIERQFGIIYDFTSDWIRRQWDVHNNVFGDASNPPYCKYGADAYGVINPVDVSDWTLADYITENDAIEFGVPAMYNNICDGIWGNTVLSLWDGERIGIHDNNINGAIAYNQGYSFITNNDVNGNFGIWGNISYTLVGEDELVEHRSLNIRYNNIHGDIISNIGITNNFLSILNNTVSGNIGGNLLSSNICYINNNTCASIVGNSIYDSSFENIAKISFNSNKGGIIANGTGEEFIGNIYNNSNHGSIESNIFPDIYSIFNNSNLGSIISNANDGEISNNVNLGKIEGNTNTGNITYNANNGDILDNANLGNITSNMNNGYIALCTSSPDNCSIYNNINNGYISGVYAADVNDTIVNK